MPSCDHQASPILFINCKGLAPVLHNVSAATSSLQAARSVCDEQAAR